MKLTYSANQSDTHVQADADGLLVNMGSNNDVTVTSGTINVGGTASVSVAGTASVDIAGASTANVLAKAGSYMAISEDGSDVADLLALSNGTALAVGVYDGDGDQLSFSSPSVIKVTPTLTTTTYSAGDAMGTVMSFADAANTPGGTGHVVRATIIDKDDLTHDGTNGQYRLDFYTTTVSVTDNSAYTGAISDVEALTFIGATDTEADGTWIDLGAAKAWYGLSAFPLPYECAATTLFAVLVCVKADSGAHAVDGVQVHLQVIAD